MSRYESVEEMEAKTLDDNRARCEFFKHFNYDPNRKIGSVSKRIPILTHFGCSGLLLHRVCLLTH